MSSTNEGEGEGEEDEYTHSPVEVPADDGKNYRDIGECEGCGTDEAALRAIKMRRGRRRMLCLGCFTQELDRGTVHPDDPRVDTPVEPPL